MLGAKKSHNIRMQTSSRNVDLYLADPVKLLHRYVTMDEACVHHFDLKWNNTVCSGSTQPHLQWSSFRESHWPQGYGVWDGILTIDYLQQGKNATGVYYAGLVRKLLEAVRE